LALFWIFSGLDLASWQKVDLATLIGSDKQKRFISTKLTKRQIGDVPNSKGFGCSKPKDELI